MARKPNIILVLGMHRSGTSAIARSLRVLGVDLGEDIFPPSTDNPRGFWEDTRCLQINEKLLHYLDSAYDGFLLRDDLPNLLQTDREVQTLLAEAVDLLRERSRRYGLWGFKDPRTARLVPFWQQAVDQAGTVAGYVIAVRNPLSVADSLAVRNGLARTKSHLLWFQHVICLLRDTAESPRVVVDYDRLLEDPAHQLERVARALGLDGPAVHSHEYREFADEFLTRDLRHTLYQVDDIACDQQAPGVVSVCYRLLAAMAADATPPAVEPGLMERALAADRPVLAYISVLEQQNLRLERIDDEHRTKIERLDDGVIAIPQGQRHDAEQWGVAGVGQLLARLGESQARRYDAEVGRRDAEREAIRAGGELDSLRARCETLETQRAKLLTRYSEEVACRISLEKDVETLRATCEQQRRCNDELTKNVSELTAALSDQTQWLREEQVSTGRLYEALLQAHEAQAKAVRDLEEVSAGTTARWRAEVLQREKISRQLDQTSEQLAVILQSSSWQLTRPLRFLRRCVITRPRIFTTRATSRAARRLWWLLPLSPATRQTLKSRIFRSLPTVFGHTRIYRNWRRINGFGTGSSASDVTTATAPVESPEYVPRTHRAPPAHRPARVICFYLPQFHAIPENDEWWGKGFTEWTNVNPARPQFVGHYQPHVPDELGCYDLLDDHTQRRQVELAKQYGIEGFCFYFYWFAGKRLLETPMRRYLADPGLDLPFCLCWANENWSRRWDGLDSEILIAQNHSAEDDLAFIEHVAQYMRDSRYIRIDGRPLLVVYRPGLLPAPAETAQRWRDWCREQGLGEIYLAYTQSFEVVDPADYGFDAALEFAPNNSGPPDITETVESIVDDFACTIYDWQVFVERSRAYRSPGYKLFRSVCPAWDNTPRRTNESTIFLNNNPADYRRWLENAIDYTSREFPNPQERIVFVNAWNEWAEGAHLEPDRRYGYAWLDATRQALDSTETSDRQRKIVVVSHDAHPHGAQYLALNLVRTLAQDFGFAVTVVLLGEGELTGQFERWGNVHMLAGDHSGERAQSLARQLSASGNRAAIVNTTVAGHFLGVLATAGLRCVALIHELPGIIASYGLEDHARTIVRAAECVVFPAACVEESFRQLAGGRSEAFRVRPQGLYKRNRYRRDRAGARGELRSSLGLEAGARIVLGVGYADHRKGVDLFVEVGLHVMREDSDTHFIWLGHWDGGMQAAVERRLAGESDAGRFIFPGRVEDTDLYYAGADLFALTSREDPFPSVVMESLEVAVPVVAFRGAGGSDELLDHGAGILVPPEATDAMAEAISTLLADDGVRSSTGAVGARIIDRDFSFRHYLFDLLDYAGVGLKRVSAVVPNYNYARYLRKRLDSVVGQIYPLYEVIVIDDASTDASIDIIDASLAATTIDRQFIRREKNSGSAFCQWRDGVTRARGDYVWICEADDYADVQFLADVVRLMGDGVVMAYSQSAQIDEQDNILAPNYLDYTADINADKWLDDYVCDGTEELAQSLSIKNTIPNVSAVVFERKSLRPLLEALRDELGEFRVAGDWLVYTELLKNGRIAYVARTLNYHRRHATSVTLRLQAEQHMAEILYMQERIRSAVHVDKAVVDKACNYALSVYRYLGLDDAYARSPADQPGVARYLRAMRNKTVSAPRAATG